MTEIELVGARIASAARNGSRRATLRLRGARVDRAEGARRSACHRVALDGHLILPGLVNAHAHLQLDCFPATPAGGGYRHAADWIVAMRSRIEQPEFRRLRGIPAGWRAWQGGLANALAGVTTVVHHDPWLTIFDEPGFPTHVVADLGWAHSLALAGSYGPDLRASLAECPPGRPWFVHAAEGIGARAATEFADLVEAGALRPGTRLVHAVGLLPAQRSAALAAGVGMVWCPASNQRLFGQVADPRAFAARGLAALGTDSRMTGSRDLLDELRCAASTGLVDAAGLLAMVTWHGARLCGRPQAGRLAAGAPADLVVLRDDGRSPAEQLLDRRRADLRLVMASGRPLVADPDLSWLFDALDQPAEAVWLDGRPKRVATALLEPLSRAGLDEPGLERRAPGQVPSTGRAAMGGPNPLALGSPAASPSRAEAGASR